MWIEAFFLAAQVFIGQVNISARYTSCTKAWHFFSKLIIAILLVLLGYSLAGSVGRIRAFDVLVSLVFIALTGYFLAVLYRFWKNTPDGGVEADDNVNQEVELAAGQYPIESAANQSHKNYSHLQNDPAGSKPQSEVELGYEGSP